MNSKKIDFLDRISFIVLLFTVFVSFIFFIPSTSINLEISKGYFLASGTMISLLFWLIARISEGKFNLPKGKLLFVASFLPLAFLISSIFSQSLHLSLIGNNFEIGTFNSFLVLYLIMFLSAFHFKNEKRLWYFVVAIFMTALVVVLFELIAFLTGFRMFKYSFFQELHSYNMVGTWNNMALFLGGTILLSLITIEFIKTSKLFKILQYSLLVLSILLLIIINAQFVWLLLGLFSLIIFVYVVSSSYHLKLNNQESKATFPYISLVIIILSIIFLFSSNLIGDLLYKYINVGNSDIRVSVGTSFDFVKKSFSDNFLIGTSPNTFVNNWSLWKPRDIAMTDFWAVDFTSSFSLLFTIVITTGILGLIALVMFMVFYLSKGLKSIRESLERNSTNYFVISSFGLSLYFWISILIYNPNFVLLSLAFMTTGVWIGSLVNKNMIEVREYSFLKDPRSSFFVVLGLVALIIGTMFTFYLYTEKYVSVVYFAKSLKFDKTQESLVKTENYLMRAIKYNSNNDLYYRVLSQVYLEYISTLLKDTETDKEIVKNKIQEMINLTSQISVEAIKQDPNQYLNYLNLANVYSFFDLMSVEGSYDQAVGAYNKSTELAPNNPLIHFSRAMLEFNHGNNTEARNFLNKALELKPNYEDALVLSDRLNNKSTKIEQPEVDSLKVEQKENKR